VLYILYGDDPFGIAETVRSLRTRMAETDPMAELNTTQLDGRRLSVAEIQTAADAAPFMGDRRLVIVDGLVGRCNSRSGDRSLAARKALAEAVTGYLPHMPPTTRLVFVEGKLDKRNPILTWATKWREEQDEPDESALIRAFHPPKAAQLPGWITRRATAHGGEIAPAASAALAAALIRDGEADLRLADSELLKLLTYAGDRPVRAADVALLVTPVGIDSVFRLVDALAERDGPRAATLLHRFLDDGEHPLRLLALVARQFRLLAHGRALLDEGAAPGALASPLGVPPFVARKVASQARRFSPELLRAALERLLEIDVGVKTGRTDAVLGLDLFVAGICGTRQPAGASGAKR
jgi:DNA polymerase-3 subunit delta